MFERCNAIAGTSLELLPHFDWIQQIKRLHHEGRSLPAVPLIEALLKAGARVQAYDPEAMRVARRLFGTRVTVADSNYDALQGADGLAIVTEWNEFRRPDLDRMKTLLKAPVIFDGRNLFAPDQMKQHGFTYYSIGRR